QRKLALFAENVRRKVFDWAAAIQMLSGGPSADPSRIMNDFTPAVDLHHARTSHALRKILSGVQIDGLQYADNGAIRAVFAFGKPAQTVEVTEKFVGPVDEVHDHFVVMKQLLR